MAKESKRLQRGSLRGAVLSPLGLKYWGIEHTKAGLNVLGNAPRHIPYSDLAGPAALTKALGFTSIALPMKDGADVQVAGLQSKEATRFITAANDLFCQTVAEQFVSAKSEIQTLAEVVARLGSPRRYASACLLSPFLNRAEKILGMFPPVIPDGALTVEQQHALDAVRAFREELHVRREAAINSFVESELSEMQAFFDSIESNPLTPEQRLAVITDEDATLVLAGAGSGKTSVIVAKAAYLVERGIRQPEQILLMAFAKDAAAEMATRIKERSGAAVDALTFHALGNMIIQEAEGKGLPLANHASDEIKFRALLRDILLNDVAKNRGLGKLLLDWFSELYQPYKNEFDFESQHDYEKWWRSSDRRTLNGDRVKGVQELLISNWLYRNGIEFEYEPVYEHDLPADARGAYKPDFRLTESGVYIEHFGITWSRGAGGSAVMETRSDVDTQQYLEDMEWKRQVHRENGTTLIETYSQDNVEHRLIERLHERLAPYVELKPISSKEEFDTLSKLGEIDGFTQTLGTFLRHFKSSGTSIAQCRDRAQNTKDVRRSDAFLRIFEPLLEAYQARLGDEIDFEDMITRATEHVESGRYKSPYHHLLVDEFQDISEGRARLLRALKAQHQDARIFAVGDDWQSIFRFTGSDIHLMRNFGEEFGGRLGSERNVHSKVDLGRTFRSVDKIALPAKRFVRQNPAQLEKKVITASKTDTPSIKVAYYERRQDGAALRATLARLSDDTAGEASVLLLGRYNHLKPKNLGVLTSEFPKLSLRFITAHASKGLEDDHVVILNAASGKMGFPSEIVDDPLLDLVLPQPENFDHAEERRLFYVALTRARTSVTILADRKRPSVFVRELLDNPEYQTVLIGETSIAKLRCRACGGRMLDRTGKDGLPYVSCENRPICGEIIRPCSACGKDLPIRSEADPGLLVCRCGAEFPVCPECSDGWLVERKGQYGSFLGCVKYPKCNGKGKRLTSA